MNRSSILFSIVQKDACGQIVSGSPACCTNEIFNSYTLSLGTDLKTLFDIELDQLKQVLTLSNEKIEGKKKHIFIYLT